MSQPTRDASVSLREITKDTLNQILNLSVARAQRNFVAPNDRSIAQAHFEEKAWFRAIYADETPVGFVMLYIDPEEPRYYLWRLMVDARYQKMGFAWQGMQQLIDFVRTQPNATELFLSYVPGRGSPVGFYEKLGFEETGLMDGDERVMRLALKP